MLVCHTEAVCLKAAAVGESQNTMYSLRNPLLAHIVVLNHIQNPAGLQVSVSQLHESSLTPTSSSRTRTLRRLFSSLTVSPPTPTYSPLRLQKHQSPSSGAAGTSPFLSTDSLTTPTHQKGWSPTSTSQLCVPELKPSAPRTSAYLVNLSGTSGRCWSGSPRLTEVRSSLSCRLGPAVLGSRMTGLKWTWPFIFSQTLKDRLPRCLATSTSAPETSCGSDGALWTLVLVRVALEPLLCFCRSSKTAEMLSDREEICFRILFTSLSMVFPFCSSSSLRAASLDSSSSFRNRCSWLNSALIRLSVDSSCFLECWITSLDSSSDLSCSPRPLAAGCRGPCSSGLWWSRSSRTGPSGFCSSGSVSFFCLSANESLSSFSAKFTLGYSLEDLLSQRGQLLFWPCFQQRARQLEQKLWSQRRDTGSVKLSQQTGQVREVSRRTPSAAINSDV
ncbi:hypothetical protein EYF80_042945 [Liparis tanakae]|uniref:Uncharacterized protein n=1 Tax=Liparis tanakae TaxID=230148 RepID=A0A4Z2FZU7_9TELE|nr:hypothetical protein EYF80_042945 [Liparis tanakae]